MITSRGGDTKQVDLDTISALVAGSFAATRQLAHQFGEKEFTALFHQGRGGNIQLSLVGDRALLTALFDDNTTVGMVRLYSTEAAKRLTTIFRRKAEEARSAVADGGSNGQAEEQTDGFLPEGQGALDDIFGSD
jgi:predicted regulator of Ras-like GTPase activity (Roadblock/LC7/MglB family)